MSLRERFESLEERERKLLGVFALVAILGILLFVPLGVTAALHSQRSENQAIEEAIAEIEAARSSVELIRAQKKALLDKYARPAPPLAAYLAKLASDVGVEIPESQDRQPVPHGKRYEEKATKLTLRKVGMLELAKFMERIEQSGHPLSITQLTIRKRSVEPDSYDVDMVVSAFERKPDKVQAKAGGSNEEAEL
ncbi:MAG: hypothetical protein DIU78_005825 [Pseudomonadota bacterium]|nr:MAG: hypothetical protein DIU78_13780 [Pseudomonadota bacterium]